MRYGSVCSGIEAATAAWHSLGWQPAWFSEIEAFPSAVLKHHYPTVPNYGDMTKFEEWPDEPISLLVGGTPCQSFSVAGLRRGLADPRGNLMLTYLAIAQRHRPRWLVWENVPGVLSSNGGRDFGTFLGALGELGYGFAYRVLDAQWFGVAQRRRRVFVVGYLGDWRRAAEVLFESESVCRNPAPSRETRQDAAKCLTAGVEKRYDFETETLPVAFSRNDDGRDAAENITPTMRVAGRAGGTLGVAQPIGFGAQMSVPQTDVDLMQTLQAKNPMAVAQPVAFDPYNQAISEVTHTLRRGSGPSHDAIPQTLSAMQVRRLTPVECERLQGFPDNYTNIPWRKSAESPDGPRYKALGNSMSVPVMRWIGQRIQKVQANEQSRN